MTFSPVPIQLKNTFQMWAISVVVERLTHDWLASLKNRTQLKWAYITRRNPFHSKQWHTHTSIII